MVTEKRGGFKAWTVLLAIGAFSLSLLGTFLVRSGVLTSVHAFASDPKRGIFVLCFLVLVIGSSLTLFAWRARKVTLGGAIGLVSRESMLLANSVLLVVACGAVLLGTLYPLAVDALNLGKLSVGAPYFNAVFVPLLVPVLFLMIPGGVSNWKEARIADIAWRLRWVAAGAVLVAAVLPFVLGGWSFGVALGLLLASWVALGSLQQVVQRLAKPGRIAGSFWGMHMAHIGIAVVVTGITLVKGYEVERDVRMGVGDSVTIAPYSFTLRGMSEVTGPNYKALRGEVEVSKNGAPVTLLQPEKRHYFSSTMPMTEAAIDSGPLRDLYVSLGDEMGGERQEWSMRIYYKPFVAWLWAGALLMAGGGLLAALDRRYRRRAGAASVTPAMAANKA
jgi:cytochrome c-type biogenesis protein CcmF